MRYFKSIGIKQPIIWLFCILFVFGLSGTAHAETYSASVINSDGFLIETVGGSWIIRQVLESSTIDCASGSSYGGSYSVETLIHGTACSDSGEYYYGSAGAELPFYFYGSYGMNNWSASAIPTDTRTRITSVSPYDGQTGISSTSPITLSANG